MSTNPQIWLPALSSEHCRHFVGWLGLRGANLHPTIITSLPKVASNENTHLGQIDRVDDDRGEGGGGATAYEWFGGLC